MANRPGSRKRKADADPLVEAGFRPATENDLQGRIVEQFHAHGALVLRINSGRRGKVAFNTWIARGMTSPLAAGAPDLIVAFAAVVFCVEVKPPGKTQNPNQVLFEKAATWVGVAYRIARSVEDADRIIDEMRRWYDD